jgi:hypothetical protein
MGRYIVGLEPLASADVEEVVSVVAPTVRRYLTGGLDRGLIASERSKEEER